MEEQMASAGWHYAPTKESNDFAKCAYCELSLDGWEDTDNPLEEHERRSPSCTFFNWRPPKRPTKKARASLQSVANSVSSLHGDDSESAAPAKKSRAKKVKKPESIDEPTQVPRGRKRPSTAAQGPVIIYDGGKDTDTENELQPPPTKKRATRASLAAESRDHKMADNSDADSVASTMSKAAKQPAKKKPGRRASKARAPSKSRTATTRKPPKNVLSDDELDRVLAADLERPLTDEEEGFKDFKTPFIRQPARRLTRSRTSIAVEESARGAPEGMLLHTSALAKRGRSRTPAVGETPRKNFNFRESGQDFSMPVRVPKHLVQEEEVEEIGKSLERKRQEGVAEGIVRGFSMDVEVEEPKVKKAPAKKATKGRKKGSVAVIVVEDEPEAPKSKRGRLVKKTGAVRSRSNTIENHIQLPAVEIVVSSQEFTAQYENPSSAAPEEPKYGCKEKLMKGASRGSAISIASTVVSVPDTPGELTEPEPAEPAPEPTPEPREPFMDVDPAPADLSDPGSVVHYDVDVARPVLAAFSDAEPEEPKKLTPQPEKPKPGKKTSIILKTKKTTRSSILSQATTLSMNTDGTASVINSGEESDMSHTSHTGPTKKVRKAVKKSDKKALAVQKNKEDILKKGSESFFGSSQSEEMLNEAKRGREKKVIESADMSAKESFIEKMNIDGGSVISDSGDAPMDVREERPAAAGRVISWEDADYPRLPAAEEELSATDVSTDDSEHVESPVDVAPSPARRPLSPMRTAINIPLATTPKPHGRALGRLASSRPWTAVELESVLANLNTGDEQEEDDGVQALSARELDMTVEEWIRFSAAEAEFRMTREAERVIAVFEREGRRAIECVEGLVTVD